MSRPQLTIIQAGSPPPAAVPFAEKLADHQAILQGFLDTHVTRNHSENTLEFDQRFLTGWFQGFMLPDATCPGGERQLLLWEAMQPVVGRQHIIGFSKGLVETGLKPSTIQRYLGSLRRFFEYVLEYPYIPSSEIQSIVAKYGRIEQPVLEYDYPVHVLDQDNEGFVLTGEQLFDFYDFVRIHYRSQNQKKYPASRTYAMIVVAGESGLRADEICHLDALPPHRDLFYEQNCLQTRYGKAAKGSGKRVRKTIFTPFAQDTLRYYETHIRPAFPNSHTNAALFLTESGERITYKDAWYHLSVVVKAGRKAGLELPARMGWHSLRKSFATNFMEQYPEQVWLLMEMLGHLNPSTLHHYVKHTRAYYDQSLNRIAQHLMKHASIQGES